MRQSIINWFQRQSNYHFVTHWRMQGSIQKVYQVLKEGKNYAKWWRPAYRASDELAPNKVRSIVQAKLPYTLIFTTELVHENPPHAFEIRASGELVGRGLWKLRQERESVEIDFTWDVRAAKPIIRRLSFFLKPFFRWNHDWVMQVGERGLQKEITRNTLIPNV